MRPVNRCLSLLCLIIYPPLIKGKKGVTENPGDRCRFPTQARQPNPEAEQSPKTGHHPEPQQARFEQGTKEKNRPSAHQAVTQQTLAGDQFEKAIVRLGGDSGLRLLVLTRRTLCPSVLVRFPSVATAISRSGAGNARDGSQTACENLVDRSSVAPSLALCLRFAKHTRANKP